VDDCKRSSASHAHPLEPQTFIRHFHLADFDKHVDLCSSVVSIGDGEEVNAIKLVDRKAEESKVAVIGGLTKLTFLSRGRWAIGPVNDEIETATKANAVAGDCTDSGTLHGFKHCNSNFLSCLSVYSHQSVFVLIDVEVIDNTDLFVLLEDSAITEKLVQINHIAITDVA